MSQSSKRISPLSIQPPHSKANFTESAPQESEEATTERESDHQEPSKHIATARGVVGRTRATFGELSEKPASNSQNPLLQHTSSTRQQQVLTEMSSLDEAFAYSGTADGNLSNGEILGLFLSPKTTDAGDADKVDGLSHNSSNVQTKDRHVESRDGNDQDAKMEGLFDFAFPTSPEEKRDEEIGGIDRSSHGAGMMTFDSLAPVDTLLKSMIPQDRLNPSVEPTTGIIIHDIESTSAFPVEGFLTSAAIAISSDEISGVTVITDKATAEERLRALEKIGLVFDEKSNRIIAITSRAKMKFHNVKLQIKVSDNAGANLKNLLDTKKDQTWVVSSLSNELILEFEVKLLAFARSIIEDTRKRDSEAAERHLLRTYVNIPKALIKVTEIAKSDRINLPRFEKQIKRLVSRLVKSIKEEKLKIEEFYQTLDANRKFVKSNSDRISGKEGDLRTNKSKSQLKAVKKKEMKTKNENAAKSDNEQQLRDHKKNTNYKARPVDLDFL